MDVFTREKRSEVMSRVRSRDTKPEMLVRRYLHSKGLRYRLNRKDLPGKPDLVFPSRRAVVFVHGCFWHGHAGCPKAKLPSTRREFWHAKIESNIARDSRLLEALERDGWSCLVIWECEISPNSLEQLFERLQSKLIE